MAGYIGNKSSVVSSGAERKFKFTITGTTTTLSNLAYTPNLVHVFHNGIRLVDGTDYTATNGTSITLTNAAENGDEVVVISYASFQPSDTVSASTGGVFEGNITVNADLTVSGNTDINGGTIDGTVIGGSTPAAISGTTGTFSGNLTVDTDTLFVDATDNRVGINETTPAEKLDVEGNIRVSGASPYLNFTKTDGTSIAKIEGVGTSGSERLRIISDITDVIDMTGMRIRNSGVKTFLAAISNNTDVAIIDLIWADLNIDPTLYQQIIVEGHNMGITAAGFAEFRFYFDGTLFSGANYRWVANRAIYDGTTLTNTAAGVFDDSWGRFANPNDSTSHWNYFALSIPNPGKNSYSQYATTAYQGWWSTSRGVDTSSRPRVEDISGYVNSATSRTICTGVRLDHTAAANWRNTDIKIYGIIN